MAKKKKIDKPPIMDVGAAKEDLGFLEGVSSTETLSPDTMITAHRGERVDIRPERKTRRKKTRRKRTR